MEYSLFLNLYSEALKYSDVDMYIAERGWQEWMDEFPEEQLGPMLQHIYLLATNYLADIRKYYKLSRAAFARMFEIPIRTVEDWEAGKRKMSAWQKPLICYALFNGRDHES